MHEYHEFRDFFFLFHKVFISHQSGIFHIKVVEHFYADFGLEGFSFRDPKTFVYFLRYKMSSVISIRCQ